MNDIMPFVRLDFITLKPYFTIKNLLIFAAAPLILTLYTGNTTISNGIFMTNAMTYVSYPFALGDQCNIDALYISLSISRETVVRGRYVFALLFDVCAGLVSFLYAMLTGVLFGRGSTLQESILVVTVLCVVFSFFQSIQIPVYFKLGYAKAKMVANMPFLVLSLFIVLGSRLLGNNSIRYVASLLHWMEAHAILAVLFGLGLWLAFLYLSYRLSLAYYDKREF